MDLSSVIASWQTKLLQLDRRNSLLYFRGKRNAVTITGTDVNALFERLQRTRSGLAFPYAERRRPSKSQNLFADQPDEGTKVVVPGDLETNEPPLPLQRILYESLSERLAEILSELKDRWDELIDALKDFVKEVQDGRQKDDTGLDPETQAPFLGVLRQEAVGDKEIEPEELIRLCRVTVELVEHVQQEISVVEFWSRPQAQADLRRWIFQYLDDQNVLPFERLEEVADRLVQLAKVNHDKLTQ